MHEYTLQRLHEAAARVGRTLPEPVSVRPPTEADAVRIRATRGCTWNRCRYCSLYREMSSGPRPLDEVLDDLVLARALAPLQAPGVFYGDADILSMAPADGVRLVERASELFPEAPRQSAYAIPASAVAWNATELAALRQAGLGRLYVEMETASARVQAFVERPASPDVDREGLRTLKGAGFELWVSIMLGLGGREFGEEHIAATIDCLNAVAPQVVRVRTLACSDQQPLTAPILEGRLDLAWFGTPPSPIQPALGTLDELRTLIDGLECETTIWCDHGSNFVPHMSGRLPEHRQALAEAVDGAERHYRAQRRPMPIRIL